MWLSSSGADAAENQNVEDLIPVTVVIVIFPQTCKLQLTL